MAETVGWTENDIVKLRAAIASGKLTVSLASGASTGSRLVTFQSLSEMRKQLALMIAEVRGTPRYRRVQWNKGI